MASPLLKCQKSTLFNILSESDCAPSTQARPLRTSSGHQNVPQLKASADQNVPQHQKTTFEVMKWFMEAIIFMKTSWPLLSDDQYSIVEEAWKLAIKAQHCQPAWPGASEGTPSVCQLPGGPSLKMDPQTRETVSLGVCLLLLYQISDIDYARQYTSFKLKISTIRGRLADGACQTVVRSNQLHLRSETDC